MPDSFLRHLFMAGLCAVSARLAAQACRCRIVAKAVAQAHDQWRYAVCQSGVGGCESARRDGAGQCAEMLVACSTRAATGFLCVWHAEGCPEWPRGIAGSGQSGQTRQGGM